MRSKATCTGLSSSSIQPAPNRQERRCCDRYHFQRRCVIRLAVAEAEHGGYPVHSFRALLEDLGTLAKNRVRVRASTEEFRLLTLPTALQSGALDLLGVTLIP